MKVERTLERIMKQDRAVNTN